ncbi:Acyl transferase/acyl hydrolase/lysophospholipase,Ketoacyl-synthetase, C- [Cinara cedri]|uniref:Acyl transferase/acyl hydrolase/lysophospholipase,Ketoacyl-synthetase, C n=1 Tax=Cinara cedri TaxID=506608 RepID=A0A5E4MAT7_9HEMI|nr:Acyl transferase/acyl hydrolase/lysophospholipase,Ketoacyl-synthetase, C- [Cinara cedri]
MTEKKAEVVISGIGGVFPECENLDEFKAFLFGKGNAITSDSRRWIPGLLGTPHGVGKLRNPEKFDYVFFGMHRKMAESLDALTRLCLERSVEAIVDAGLNPADLSGTNTAVFMNSCISESEFFEVLDTHQKGFGLLGHNRAMQANRLSYSLNLNGPSYTTDSTWIGGSQSLMRAKKMIEDGVINAAIVGSCNLCLNPNISLQYEGLGRLNNTNETRSFSVDANGTNRAESCVSLFLQKSTEAKRSYGTLLSAISIFGETKDYFCHYSDNLYKEVLLKSYKEAGVDPAKVAFVEAEGLGIKKIDAMELNVLSEVFCTPNRKEPLKIGSVKSNVGHCEAASSLVSLAKVLIILDSGYIPPNINYLGPNPDCPALLSGKLKVVTEKTPLEGDTVGISAFGLCNSFSHLILKQNNKSKKKIYEKGEMFDDGLARLILVSGRNEDGVKKLLKHIKNTRMDEEFAALLQSVFYKSMTTHYSRSFCVLPDKNEGIEEQISYLPAVIKRPIWFIFSGMGSQWNCMGKQLLTIPIFADSIQKCETILKPKGVDLIEILTSEDPKLFDNILNSFVGIAAIQIGLVDVLKSIDILPDGIIGHSVGELGCAYADGCFTAEQMILAAHARGRASIETKLINGMMAAIGLGYNDIKNRLPHDVEVACHNASDSSTLSGPADSVISFVQQLKSEGVFAKAVNVSNIAYHSQYIKPAAPTLLQYLKEVIPESKPRSSKWISSSIPESEWDSELAKTSSPEYHTNNLLGQVLFEEASRHIPEDAITIEIAPHGLLQAILKRSLPSKVTKIPLTNRTSKDSVRFLLNAFGKMYMNGMNPNIEAFYPLINYPVSRETQALHSLLPWDHTENWKLKSMVQSGIKVPGETRFTISLDNENNLFNYKINGRHIIPISYFLIRVWKLFLNIKNEFNFDGLIAFQDLNFYKNIEIMANDSLEFYSLIQCGSGYFEVCLGEQLIFSGKIYQPDLIDMTVMSPKMKYPSTVVSDIPHSSITKHDLYTLMEHHGYELGEKFMTVTNIDLYFEEYQGNIKWSDNWLFFMNGIFTFLIHKSMENNNSPAEITSIRQICIDPSKFQDLIGKDVPIHYNFKTNEIKGEGLYILHPEIKPMTIRSLNPFKLRLEEEWFINLSSPNFNNEVNFINNCLQIIFGSIKYQLNQKMLNNFHIYYSEKEQTMFKYLTLVKQIFDNQIGIQHSIVSLDSSTPENFLNKVQNVVLITKGQIENVIKTLKNKKKVNLLVLSDEQIFSNKEWTVIMQQKFNGHYLALIKKIREKSIINLQVDNFINFQNIHNEINILLTECKKSKSYLYICSKVIPFVKLTSFVEEILIKNSSKLIKFVFILDKCDLDFNVHNELYAEQLRKNVFLNIYKDGKWGTIARNIVENSNSITPIDNNHENPKNFQMNSVILDGFKVKYLGINFQDITVNNVINNELGHLEYSGLTADGKMIMGIVPFEKNTSKKISPDPYLMWVIPPDWSLEDAATVPLPYALAYYIFNVLTTTNDKLTLSTILIHAGFNAFGQAAIAIGLQEGYDIYTTVENADQARLLRKRFPSLPEKRIFSYKNSDFEVQVMLATKGKGVSMILNCLSGSEFYASVRSLSTMGKFFQLTRSDMIKKNKLGMFIFLKVIAFYGVSLDRLLGQDCNIKLRVQKDVQKGIELGIVKPFDRHVLTGTCTGEQAIKALNLSSQGIESKRVVLSLEGEKTLVKSVIDTGYEKYKCYSNRVYLIVGSKYSTWIDLAEWLTVRGAQKIVVALKKYAMSTIASRRLNLLMARYQNTMVQIVSDSYLNSKEDSIQLLKETTTTTPLGGILFATLSDDKNKIYNIKNAFENLQSLKNSKPWFVCIMSGGDEIFAELRANGVCPNAINLSWSSMETEPTFSNILPSLDKVLVNINTISSSTIICTEYNKRIIVTRESYSKIVAELPKSIEELNVLADTLEDEPEFVEVFTKSPRFADNMEGLPVFVVPGFQPGKIKRLYENIIYPTFEARLPETIDSIESIATILVQKLKTITKCKMVSLIGISWGGAVCIAMAQILEAEDIAVSLTLLEGLPNVFQEWTTSLNQYGNINAKLIWNYFQISNTVAKKLVTKSGWTTELPKVLSSNGVTTDSDKTLKALNSIRSKLNTILALKPFTNKVLTKVMVINRNINVEKSSINGLMDYCIHVPGVYNSDEIDFEEMLVEKKVIQIINRNILHYHPDSMDTPIKELYIRSSRETIGYVIVL